MLVWKGNDKICNVIFSVERLLTWKYQQDNKITQYNDNNIFEDLPWKYAIDWQWIQPFAVEYSHVLSKKNEQLQ